MLDLTFRVYRTTFFSCLLLAALGVIGGQLAGIYQLANGHQLLHDQHDMQALLAQLHDPALGVLAVLYLVGMVLSLVFYGAVLLRQRGLLTGQPAGGELTAVLRRLPPVIGLGLLVALAMVACFVPGLLCILPPAGRAGLGVTIMMFLLGVVAFGYIVVAISCAWTIFFVDGAGPLESLTRSWRLTAGNFWRLSVVYTVALIVLFAGYSLIGAVTAFISAVMGGADFAVVTTLIGVVGVAMGALVTPFYTALAIAVLADLSVRKEGADLERRISAA